MKMGRSLTDLATEIERQHETKRDYTADTRRLKMEPLQEGTTGNVIMQGVNGGMKLKPIAHAQLASTLGIPKPYYDKMLAETPELLSKNVNHWLERQEERKLIRTLDNEIRAILSPSYRPLDNYDLAHAVLPTISQLGATTASAEITDSRFYLKCITDKVTGEVAKGDLMQAGVVISNSEVGHGSLRIEALDYRLVCTNGLISETAIRKAHLGRSARGGDSLEDAREFFKDETRAADDHAFFLKVRDAVVGMFDPTKFNKRLDKYRALAAIPMNREPEETIELVAKKFALTEQEQRTALRHLFTANDQTRWGLANAITRTAQDATDYDRATVLETLGGKIVHLTANEWVTIS